MCGCRHDRFVMASMFTVPGRDLLDQRTKLGLVTNLGDHVGP